MTPEPLVSVVIPVYRVEQYLRQCLQSVIGQTLSDIEIIAVDDGSPDGCGRMIDEFAAQDPRVVPIHKPNGGYGSAVNAGLAVARGRYVSIVESDDYVSATMLEDLHRLACDTSADIARGSYVSFHGDETVHETVAFRADERPFAVDEHPSFLVVPPSIWSAIYRRGFLESNSLRIIETPGAAYQDVDFFVRSALLAKVIACTSSIVYHYRLDNAGSSTNSKGNVEAIFRNFSATDDFVATLEPLQGSVLANYNKRKVCDIQWNFRRIAQQHRPAFAALASQALGRIEIGLTWPWLNGGQRLFLVSMRYFPALAVVASNLAARASGRAKEPA